MTVPTQTSYVVVFSGENLCICRAFFVLANATVVV